MKSVRMIHVLWANRGTSMKSREPSAKNNPALEHLLSRKQCVKDEIHLLYAEIKELKEELRHKQSLIREINTELAHKDHKATTLKLVYSSS